MKESFKTRRLLLFLLLFVLLCVAGCKGKGEEYAKTGDVDFTVVEEADVPKELLDIIVEKKKEPFRLSYLTESALYLAIGYGEMPTGGYSISVEELYQAEEGLCIRTKLSGPSKDEKVTAALTYPFIVLKLQPMETKLIMLK